MAKISRLDKVKGSGQGAARTGAKASGPRAFSGLDLKRILMSSAYANATRQLPPIRACIFDVDGTLIDSEDIYTELYNNILHEYGKPDLPWRVKAKQQSRGSEGMRHLLEWAQLPITLDGWNAKVGAQRELFKKSKPLAGVPELLANLSQRAAPQVHVASASSASRPSFAIKTSHLPEITKAILEQYRVFGSDEAMQGKRKKPAPDIFLLALERVNEALKEGERRVAPEECLVFEDSVAGVQSGRRAGMRVIWVPHTGLRDVFRGREKVVLEGGSETTKDGQLGDEATEGARITTLRSSDGLAEMLSSLEDFPYEKYGIHLKTSKVT